MQNIIGRKVQMARNHHVPKLTQADLAAQLQVAGLDISRSGIAKIENGLRQVTDKEVALLARVLGVSVAWLFGEETDANNGI